MLTRRVFLGSLAGSLLAAPLAAGAEVLPRVAMLFPGSPVQQNELVTAFLQAMRENGYVDARDFAFDLRYFGTRPDELDRVLGELLPLRPAVIITIGSPAALAAKRATTTIPIVMATVADPVGQGLVASMARPGGNLTGNAILRSRRSGSDEIALQRPEALMVEQENLFWITRTKIAQAMLRNRVPSIHAFREAIAEGGLMSYANSTEAMFRNAAVFVARILKGARPSDLPVEQPTKFELVSNLKTAKALGLTIPPSLLARADEVIQ